MTQVPGFNYTTGGGFVWGGVDVSQWVSGASATADTYEVASIGDRWPTFVTSGWTITITLSLPESGIYWQHEK